MARNIKWLSEDEVANVERQAELQRRNAAAVKQLKGITNPVARIKANEDERRAAWHKRNMDARARRLEGMVATEAGRYNPQQQADALKWLEENGYGKEGERRRQFDEGQKTLRIESENKMHGMVGQGSEAAKHNAEATIGAATITANANKEIEEGKRAAEKWLGELDSKTKKELAEIKADSDYDVADITGQHNEAAAKYNADASAATVMSKQLMDKYKVDTLSGDRQAAIIQRAKKGDQDAINKLRKGIVERIGNGDVDELTIEQAEEMAENLGFSLNLEHGQQTPTRKKSGGTSQFLRTER